MATPEIYVDPLIGASPSEVLAMRGGSYDAGSRTSHELALWAPPIQSADMDLLPEKPIMDARVRDTLRNDAYVQNGSNIHKDHIVGEVFLLNSKPTRSEEHTSELQSRGHHVCHLLLDKKK